MPKLPPEIREKLEEVGIWKEFWTYRKRLVSIKARQEATKAAEESESGITIEARNGWCVVAFAEKPEYDVIRSLKDAGFRWSRGSWLGSPESLPAEIEA